MRKLRFMALCVAALVLVGCGDFAGITDFSFPDLPFFEAPEQIKVEDIHEDGLAFAALTDDQKILYKQMLDGVNAREESFELHNARQEDVEPAYHAMMIDHPELFWLDGSTHYTYFEGGSTISLTTGLSVPLDEVDEISAQIEAVVEQFLDSIPEGADDYIKAKMAYDFVIATTDYDVNSSHNQNIQSVFLGHESVCAGYARAYQYLLQRAGVFCSLVEGTIPSSAQDHAWNIVRMGNSYTYVDVTWGDPTYVGLDSGDVDIVYDYLGLTTEELLRDDHNFADESMWPACEDESCSYYAHEGLLFDTSDETVLSASLWQQHGAGARPVVFKFTNEASYLEARARLDTGEFLLDDIRQILTEAGTLESGYQYSFSDALYIIKLFL